MRPVPEEIGIVDAGDQQECAKQEPPVDEGGTTTPPRN